MIQIHSPIAQGGYLWVLCHDLVDRNNWGHDVRSINALTFLGQAIKPRKDGASFSLGLALENKLAGVERTHRDFIARTTALGSMVPDPNIRPYTDEQNFLSALECHLHSIYSALEVTAELNKLFNPLLPKSFRRQAKKYAPFSFEKHPWLKEFYDLRSELTHYNTGIPARREKKLVIDFRSTSVLSTNKCRI